MSKARSFQHGTTGHTNDDPCPFGSPEARRVAEAFWAVERDLAPSGQTGVRDVIQLLDGKSGLGQVNHLLVYGMG
jgi:hypothetical protein